MIYVESHLIIDDPDFYADIDEYKDPDGNSMPFIHVRVNRFTPSILKRIKEVWSALRASVQGPIFCSRSDEDETFRKWLDLFEFRFVGAIPDGLGGTARVYVSFPEV